MSKPIEDCIRQFFKVLPLNLTCITPSVDHNMNQTEMVEAVKKMQTYVALAEQEIAAHKKECQFLQDELCTSRRLRESLEETLRETEETLSRHRLLKRVSQFKLKTMESGGTIQVCIASGEPCLRESTLTVACQGKGCCRIEWLYLANGRYEEIESESQSVRLLPNVISLKTTGQHGMYSVILSRTAWYV